MSKTDTQAMSATAYKKMVDTMIMLYNRGPQVGTIVKRIAKAGDVGEVMQYANHIHKTVMKYRQQSNGAAEVAAPARKAAKRGRSRRKSTAESGGAAEG